MMMNDLDLCDGSVTIGATGKPMHSWEAEGRLEKWNEAKI
jgi:hypothetical protein